MAKKIAGVSKTPRLVRNSRKVFWVCVMCTRINTMDVDSCQYCGDVLSEKDVDIRNKQLEYYQKHSGW